MCETPVNPHRSEDPEVRTVLNVIKLINVTECDEKGETTVKQGVIREVYSRLFTSFEQKVVDIPDISVQKGVETPVKPVGRRIFPLRV